MAKEPTYAIRGVPVPPGPPGTVPIRLDVDEWYTSKDPVHELQVTLFLLALAKFEEMSSEDKLSYFQVAGKFPGGP